MHIKMNICLYVQRKIRHLCWSIEKIWSARYVSRIILWKRKDRLTWHCRCPFFFLQLFREDISQKKRACQLEWPLLFVYMYVDLLSLSIYIFLRWRRTVEFHREKKICSVSFSIWQNRWNGNQDILSIEANSSFIHE
jgi:hypothetical protein